MEQQSFLFNGENKILSVSDLVNTLRFDLEKRYRNLCLQGEISNLRRPGSGHLYFTLKDEKAQIAAVCFRLRARYLRFEPEDGMDVLARGAVTVYPARGQLQMVVDHLEPLGQGALQLAFEQLKVKLQKEGLFGHIHKKKLPLMPTRVGVVTSPSGAAIQDILRVLERRDDRVSILLFPARVQGAGAAREIVAGIEYLDQHSDVDVIIVGRGGGSLEDLWPFNEEVVARAIFRSNTPIISAVGHEIDFTISDFVADLRAATPSAAAELVSGKRHELNLLLSNLGQRLHQSVRRQIGVYRQRLEILERSRGFVDAEGRVRLLMQRLDELRMRLSASIKPVFQRDSQRLAGVQAAAIRQTVQGLRERKRDLTALQDTLKALSPMRVLKRGYAITTSLGGEVLRDPNQLEKRELFHVQVARGRFRARKED